MYLFVPEPLKQIRVKCHVNDVTSYDKLNALPLGLLRPSSFSMKRVVEKL